MALITRVEPIDDFLEVSVREDLSPEAQSKAIAAFARERLVEAQQANQRVLGRATRHDTFVDGRAEAPLESVRPIGGRIVFEFELLADMLRSIAKMLVERSPVVKGDYLRGHRLFADGVEVAVGADGTVPLAEEYTFLNLVPYARKIEIGKTKSGRPFVVQVPPRIYERTAKDARARFGNLAKIAFGYRAPVGGSILQYQRAGTPNAAVSRVGGAERINRVPAIIVTVK